MEIRAKRTPDWYPGRCGRDGQPAQLFTTHQLCGIGDSPDVHLDQLPLTVEPPREMLPPGLDLSHPPGCFQPLVVPLGRLARAGEIRLMRLIP